MRAVSAEEVGAGDAPHTAGIYSNGGGGETSLWDYLYRDILSNLYYRCLIRDLDRNIFV